MGDGKINHELTYRRRGPDGWIHRSRLRLVLDSIREATAHLPAGVLADFGCSNGFILGEVRRSILPPDRWTLRGFDHTMQHIAEAQTRGIANAQFALVELNEFDPSTPFEQFDVITCLETIEHTGNPANALKNLVARTKPGGRLLIAVPDEQGLLGLTKLLARPLLRRCPYGSFFAGKSFTDYAVRVALRRPIGHFRAGGVKGYGPHLGWDVEAFERDLLGNEEAAGTLRRLWRRSVLGGFGRLYLFERA